MSDTCRSSRSRARRARAWRGAVAAALAAFAPLAGAGPLDEASYALGRGLTLPALDLTLSGYASLHLESLEGADARFDVRDLSLFASWAPAPRWQVFTEIEGEDVVTIDERGLTAHDTEVVVERLYFDFAATSSLNVRVGRYLTPVGRWNLVHAEPLVWTVTRPLVTVIAIPDHASGMQVYGNLPVAANSLEYSVYVDDSDDLDPVNGEASFEEFSLPGLSNNFDHALGGQLRYHLFGDHAEIGASYALFDVDGERGHHHLFGLDALVRLRGMEFSSESIYRSNDARHARDDWGGFVQAVLPLHGPLYTFGRVEYYSSGVLSEDAGRASIGLALRPRAAVTYKFEYHDGSNGRILPDGWEISCGILF